MKLSKELKTAIIVLGGILLFIMGFSYLKSNSIFSKSRTFYVVYNHVGGLTPATAVTINGFTVGKIQNIKFKDDKGKLLVTLSIDNGFDFSKNSKAELYDTGIIGGKGIQIIPIFDGSISAQSGDTLQPSVRPGLTELVTQKLTPLQEKVEKAVTSADSVLVGFNQVLDPQSKKNLRETINGLNEMMANFKKSSIALNQILSTNKDNISTSLENINTITDNFSALSDSLSQANIGVTMSNLQQTVNGLNNILSNIEKGEGTLGKLMSNEEMYNNLNGASKQLDLLLEDMRLNPKRYVHFSLFGKKNAPYKAAEETENNN